MRSPPQRRGRPHKKRPAHNLIPSRSTVAPAQVGYQEPRLDERRRIERYVVRAAR